MHAELLLRFVLIWERVRRIVDHRRNSDAQFRVTLPARDLERDGWAAITGADLSRGLRDKVLSSHCFSYDQ